MRRLATLAACVIMAACAQAQKRAVYCDLMDFSSGTSFGKKLISIDFGNSAAQDLLDVNGQKIKFKSVIDALNYMARQGWRLVTTDQVSTSAVLSKTNVAHYYLTKDVENDNEIYSGLNVKPANK